jgi:hypothetical protein
MTLRRVGQDQTIPRGGESDVRRNHIWSLEGKKAHVVVANFLVFLDA